MRLRILTAIYHQEGDIKSLELQEKMLKSFLGSHEKQVIFECGGERVCVGAGGFGNVLLKSDFYLQYILIKHFNVNA